MECMVTEGINAVPVRWWRFRQQKYFFAIWSKTFELDDLAIALYLVEVDQMVAKGVRAMNPASTR
jgi:hypothetical protein